uniref:C2H2-type domain-containing protein n=1 Tax=Plectus sambesii TaxID=2011161 RepID=A0A914X380_9BILA
MDGRQKSSHQNATDDPGSELNLSAFLATFDGSAGASSDTEGGGPPLTSTPARGNAPSNHATMAGGTAMSKIDYGDCQQQTTYIVVNQSDSTTKHDHMADVDDLLAQLNAPGSRPSTIQGDDGVEIRVLPLSQTHMGQVMESGSSRQATMTLMQGSSGQQVLQMMPSTSMGESQQIMIPLDGSVHTIQAGNTILLPIIPTLMPDGKIEMRVAGNAIPYSAAAAASSSSSSTATSHLNFHVLQQQTLDPDDSFQSVDAQTDSVVDQATLAASGRMRPKEPANTKRLWNCEFCDYTNARRYLLVRHMKSHSEHRPHECHMCERSFKTASSLANHINTHTGLKPFDCDKCEMAFTTSGELVRHQRYRHTMEKPHKCPDCDYATVELSKLKRHVRSHTGERPFKCSVCSYTSADQYKMKRHVRVHTGERPYECEVCGARFTQSNSLKTHRLTHNPVQEKPMFPCEYCAVTCGRKTDLRIHIEKQHRQGKPLPCSKCGQAFPDRYSFRLHWKSHQGQKCFRCPHCPYQSAAQRHLEQHMMVHSDVKPFECSEPGCGRRFRQLAQLKRHHNVRHDPFYQVRVGEKTHVCPASSCGRPFRHLGNLKRHIEWHNENNTVEQQYEGEDGDDSFDAHVTAPSVSSSDAPAAATASTTSTTKQNASAVLQRIVKLENRKSVKVFNLTRTQGAATNRLKRPRGRPKKRTFKPEDLGMTNVKRRGRPKNQPAPAAVLDVVASLQNHSAEEQLDASANSSVAASEQLERELEERFGFDQVGDHHESAGARADEDRSGRDSAEHIIVDGDDDQEPMQADPIQYPHDAEGFPILAGVSQT